MFTDDQWEAIRGEYPADLFARCRRELLGPIVAAVMDWLPDETVDRLSVEAVGDEFPVEFGPFSEAGWAPLKVSDELVAHVHARQLWPSEDLTISPLVEFR